MHSEKQKEWFSSQAVFKLIKLWSLTKGTGRIHVGGHDGHLDRAVVGHATERNKKNDLAVKRSFIKLWSLTQLRVRLELTNVKVRETSTSLLLFNFERFGLIRTSLKSSLTSLIILMVGAGCDQPISIRSSGGACLKLSSNEKWPPISFFYHLWHVVEYLSKRCTRLKKQGWRTKPILNVGKNVTTQHLH